MCCTACYYPLENAGAAIADTALCVVTTIGENVKNAALKTGRFIRDNKTSCFAYLLGWGVIVAGTGLMYGFSAVALPLTIGLACGFGFGLLSGIVTVKLLDPDNEHPEFNTVWGLLNWVLNEKITDNGTRAVVLSVVVTVVLASAVVFSIATGAALGFIAGNHLATKIGHDRDFGPEVLTAEELEDELAQVSEQIKVLKDKLDTLKTEQDENLSAEVEKEETSQISKLERRLQRVTVLLEKNQLKAAGIIDGSNKTAKESGVEESKAKDSGADEESKT